ncbi:YidC/Oxa1 family membrane protein insertase [Haploplasma axanthum]|uniref:Membrane protein YidC 1 n=1 Tax=Haploplasma axanthum TaxID=29552 RepID=A0A449BBY0_HAPAX|nr:YidC/Oxa1 family membrane protein insertase [Haploplasma axanthum]VEU79945.1 Membrane protein YidC 1 [Haploplasma axanthum]
MRKINKALLVVVLLFTALLLSSCRSNKDQKNETPVFVVHNQLTDKTFVDEFTNTKEVSIEAWFVLYNGKLTKVELRGEAEVKYQFATTEFLTETEVAEQGLDIKNANVKKYIYTVSANQLSKEFLDKRSNEKIEFNQYQKKTTSESIGVAVNYVKLNDKGEIASTGAILTDSYVYTGENVDFYDLKANGESSAISKDNITFTGFPEGDDLIENRKYINYVSKDVTATIDNITEPITLKVWLAEGYAPLSTKTATFWNWLFLQMPIAFAMSFIGSITGKSFAIAVLLTTIIVRTLAWPIYAKTNDMSLKMSVAQPDLDRLNRKYATRKDPESQQKMQMEMMQIYKKHKISMWGCLLPFLQMPIFFAMYEVVRRITIPGGQFANNVANTKIFGLDLDSNGMVAKIFFTLLVGLTMFALQRISSKKPSYAKNVPQQNKNPQGMQTEKTMKMVNYFMIFMMVMTSYVTPGFAVSYYWIIGNIYSMAQTLFNRQLNEKRYKKLEEEKLYGRSREIIDAEIKKKGEK